MRSTLSRLLDALKAEAKLSQQPADQFLTGVEPRSASARTRRRWLRLTHRSAASGSPRIADCTNSSNASSSPGSVSIFDLLPPPGRRIRPVGWAFSLRSSTRPRPIVLRATPVASDTAVIPTNPGQCFIRCEQPPRSLVEMGRQPLKACLDSIRVDHPDLPEIIRSPDEITANASSPFRAQPR